MTDSACQRDPSGALFSDRYWILKVGLAVGLFAILCRRSNRELAEIHPDIQYAAAETDLYLGKMVHAMGHRVLAVTPEGFDLETGAGPVRVAGRVPSPKPGDHVTIEGRIAAPKRIEASALRIDEGYLWKRGLNYALSSLTVLAFLWFVRRRFRWKLTEGVFRSRY